MVQVQNMKLSRLLQGKYIADAIFFLCFVLQASEEARAAIKALLVNPHAEVQARSVADLIFATACCDTRERHVTLAVCCPFCCSR